jgi:hypothetical protein
VQPAQPEAVGSLEQKRGSVAAAKKRALAWGVLLQWLGMIALATAIALLVWWLLS